jgi:hypothetical protein
MIDARGRNLTSAVIQIIPCQGYLHIRIDCEEHPETWFEIDIPETDLLAQLAKVHRLRPGIHDAKETKSEETNHGRV